MIAVNNKPDSLGVLEIIGLSPAMVALDALEKSASVRLLQIELNDFYGVVLKIVGRTDAIEAAVSSGAAIVEKMGGQCTSTILNAPDEQAWKAIETPLEYSPILETNVVRIPDTQTPEASTPVMQPYAIGLIETQGFTAVFEAIDAACKAADVEVIGKEKLGGGYITVIIRGDVAAVRAAVEAGQSRVEGLGKLIAAHIIPRPSEGVLSLLPKS